MTAILPQEQTPAASQPSGGQPAPSENEPGPQAGASATDPVAAALDRLREAAAGHDCDSPEAP
jgi:hypothetical protein